MEDRTIEIIGLNETRLDNTIPDSQVDIKGYDILCRDRNRNGGGVAFYVAQSLTCVKRQDLLSHEDLEILKVEIKKKQSPSLSSWQLGIDLQIRRSKFLTNLNPTY